MNKFENALLNPEPTPIACYLQEEDPPEEHDLERLGAVCGQCYGAAVSLMDAAERLAEFRKNRIDQLEAALTAIDHTLRIPAAEYVPAIGDVFTIIDRCMPDLRNPTMAH